MSACALAKNSDIWLAVGAASAELEAAARMAKVMKDANIESRVETICCQSAHVW